MYLKLSIIHNTKDCTMYRRFPPANHRIHHPTTIPRENRDERIPKPYEYNPHVRHTRNLVDPVSRSCCRVITKTRGPTPTGSVRCYSASKIHTTTYYTSLGFWLGGKFPHFIIFTAKIQNRYQHFVEPAHSCWVFYRFPNWKMTKTACLLWDSPRLRSLGVGGEFTTITSCKIW